MVLTFSRDARCTVSPLRISRLVVVLAGASVAAGISCAGSSPSETFSEVESTTSDATTASFTDAAVPDRPAAPSDAGVSSPGLISEGTSPEPSSEQPPHCSPGAGATGSPTTISEVVELINSLPMPVTLPCFLQSLDRPLQLVATNSIISAQPSQGVDNPRLFILGEGISLSVVPTGKPGNFLEIGEFLSNTTSVKAEVEFPVSEPLTPEAPFTRLHATDVYTVCRICHFPEYPAADYPVAGAYESIAYRPLPQYEVNFDYVEWQYSTCDSAAEPDRCAFYSALFDQGQISRGEFPEDVPLFQ